MEMSVREARAQFAAALSAAERGERVTITKNGKAVAELGPPTTHRKLDWKHMKRSSAEMGIERPKRRLDEAWRREFDDPAFSLEALGLPQDDE